MVQFTDNFSHNKKKKLLVFVSVFVALTALILGTIYVSINLETILQPFRDSKSFCVKNDSAGVIHSTTTEQPRVSSTQITPTSTTLAPSSPPPPPPPPVPTSASTSTESASTPEGGSSSASTATKGFVEDNVDNKNVETTTTSASTSEAGFQIWDLDDALESKESSSSNLSDGPSSDEDFAELLKSSSKTKNETSASASRTPDSLGPGEAASRSFQLVESIHKKHNVIGESINKWVKEILQKAQKHGDKAQKKDANDTFDTNRDLTSTPTSSV